MTRFSDQLFDDLMQEHGPELTAMRTPAAPRRRVAHPVRLGAVAAGVVAVAAGVGLTVPGGGAPSPAAAAGSGGSVTLTADVQSGSVTAAQAALNQQARKLGRGIDVVPVEAGCPSYSSLPSVPGIIKLHSDPHTSKLTFTVNGHAIPKGDTVVLPFSMGNQLSGHHASVILAPVRGGKLAAFLFGKKTTAVPVLLTAGHVPSCVSVPGIS